MSIWVRIHLFVLTSLDHPSSVDWTEILNSGGEGFNHRNHLELNIGHCNSRKLFKQGALGDFSLATFFCGFQSPTMFLPLDSSHNSLILVFPASLSWSKILLMFSDKQSPVLDPTLKSHRRIGRDFLFQSFLSLPYLPPKMELSNIETSSSLEKITPLGDRRN